MYFVDFWSHDDRGYAMRTTKAFHLGLAPKHAHKPTKPSKPRSVLLTQS